MQVPSLVPLARHAVTHVLLHTLALAQYIEVNTQTVQRALHALMAGCLSRCQDRREQWRGCRQEDTPVKEDQAIHNGPMLVLLSSQDSIPEAIELQVGTDLLS